MDLEFLAACQKQQQFRLKTIWLSATTGNLGRIDRIRRFSSEIPVTKKIPIVPILPIGELGWESINLGVCDHAVVFWVTSFGFRA